MGKMTQTERYRRLTLTYNNTLMYYRCVEFPALAFTSKKVAKKCIDVYIRVHGLVPKDKKDIKKPVKTTVTLFYSRWLRKESLQEWEAVFEGTDNIWKTGTQSYLIKEAVKNNYTCKIITRNKEKEFSILKTIN